MASDGPVAIVTGGAQGLGVAIAKALLEAGHRVCVADIQEKTGLETVEQLKKQYGLKKVFFTICDVSDENQYKRLFEETIREFHRIDVLVNNAGIILEQNPRKVLEVNLMGPIIGCQTALKYMGTDSGGNGGSVVNVASIAGLLPFPVGPVYSATKHGVVGLTRSFGKPVHFDKHGIYFTALCPSFIDTPLLGDLKTNLVKPIMNVAESVELLEPAYVADGVIKLLKERKNGSTLMITKDGGHQYIGLGEELEKVCIADVNEGTGKNVANEFAKVYKEKVLFVKCDVTKLDDFEGAFKKTVEVLGKVNLLLNNAGTMDERRWRKVIEINIVGVIYGIELGFKYMGFDNRGSGGYVINTASIAGLDGFDMCPVYSGSKHAVVGLTKSFGSESHLKKTGVIVSAICPGPVNTELYQRFPAESLDSEAATEFINTIKPINPSEVAKALVQLLQDRKNGALLRVDGDGIKYVTHCTAGRSAPESIEGH